MVSENGAAGSGAAGTGVSGNCDGTDGAGDSGAGATVGRKIYDWAAIQHAYEETDLTIAQIHAVFGVSTSALYRRIKRECWRQRQEPFVQPSDTVRAAAPQGEKMPDRPAMPTTTAGLRSFRKGMIVRLYEALDRQLVDIEQQQVGGTALSGAERERQTRQMNVMTRSMEKLAEFHEQEASRETRGRKRADKKSGKAPRDPETWRVEIARRITRIREKWLAENPARDG